MRRISLAALLLIPFLASALVVAERGRASRYAIRFAADAGKNVRYAADELRDYVGRLTDVKLPVAVDGCPTSAARSITLREIEDPSLGQDGFMIKIGEDGNIVISGGKRGVLYGVYELLERYGDVGWFASWRTFVPRLERFELPDGLDIREKPTFPMRTAAWLDSKRNGDFCARLRLNGNRCPLEAKHGGLGLRAARGNGHTFRRYMPPAEFFADHPEYYALFDGKRNPGQPCLTHPDVLPIFKKRVLDWMRRYPDGDLYMVTQNDNHVYCHCDTCLEVYGEEGSPSGAILRFVNAIAEEVEKEFPDKVVETYAYMWSQKPPRNVRPRRNVMIYLCNDGTQGPPYLDRHKTLWEQRDMPYSFAKTLEAWSKVTGRIHIFDYITNFSRSLYAFPIELTFAPNFKFYRDCGVEYVNGYGGARTLHSDFAELKLWLYAKLAWNPDQDVEKLLRRFFQGYYGAAASQARKVFDILQKEYPKNQFLGMYQRNKILYSDNTLAECERLWDEALDAVKKDKVLSHNVRMSALTVAYMRFERRKLPKRFFVTRNPRQFAFNDETSVRLVKKLRAGLAECKDLTLAESKADRKEQMDYMERVETATHPSTGCDSAILEESAFTRLARSHRAKFEDDAKAQDGKAMRCFNKLYSPAAQLKFSDVAFDPNVAYRVRVRARVAKCSAAGDKAAFGVYVRGRDEDELNAPAKTKWKRVFTISETSENYAWYDLPAWIPAESDTLQILRGDCDKRRTDLCDIPDNIWIDCIKIERADENR